MPTRPNTAKTCFVIMPFSTTRTPRMTEVQWEEVFERTFRPAVEAVGYTCFRSPNRPGNFVKDIIESLNTANIVLADLTGHKPNVFYELGIRHALRARTILVAQRADMIPSDLRSYWCATYGWQTEGEREKFKSEIRDLIAQMDEDPGRVDSPVFDYLQLPSQVAAIDILPSTTAYFGMPESDPREPGGFATIQITNHGPFVPRVQCSLQFFRMDGSPVFHREMPGRWSSAPEPITIVGVPVQDGIQPISVADFTKVPLGYFTDLAAKEVNFVSAAVKFADGTCWGWTPESYMYKWRHPQWRLPAEELEVEIRILANGRTYSQRVRLDTSVPLENFAIREFPSGLGAAESPLTRYFESEVPSSVDRTDVKPEP